VSTLSLVRSSLEGCNGIVGVKAIGERSNKGSWTMGFNKIYRSDSLKMTSLVPYQVLYADYGAMAWDPNGMGSQRIITLAYLLRMRGKNWRRFLARIPKWVGLTL
jgi:hypothetical protein